MNVWRACIYGLLAFVILALVVISAKAQEQPAFCLPIKSMMDALEKERGQHVVFAGQSGFGRFVITQGKAGNWTLLQAKRDGKSICILANGEQSRLVIPGLPI